MAGIDVNQQNLSGTYPLFLAVSLGAEDVVKVILEKGADVNIVNDNGKTPLFESIFHELDDIVKLLLHAGANVNQICNAKTEHHAGNGRGKNLKYIKCKYYDISFFFFFLYCQLMYRLHIKTIFVV